MGSSKKQANESAKKFIALCMDDSNAFDENKAREVTKALATENDSRYLTVLEQFKELVKLELNKQNAVVISALKLSNDSLFSITSALEKIYNRKLRLESKIDESLIGGFKVTIGSDVYDHSTLGRLGFVKNALSS
ncbi:MAG: ATP synthase F1 subunit delta [Planctomycetota bacterium]|nr:MAG: ATP synthase F1 subunit delta [Planctomycetota bacterium]